MGLAALAATSTDAMVRRLGFRRWQLLHRIVYVIAALAVVHFCMQSKLDLWEPTIMAGIYAWLMGYRALMPLVAARQRLPLAWLTLLGLAVTGLTAFGEALYFHLAYGVDLMRVIDADFSLATGIRPAAIVFGLTFALTLIAALRTWMQPAAKERPRFA